MKKNKKLHLKNLLSGNSGNWSELLVHCYILIKKKIYRGDRFHKSPKKPYKFIRVIRIIRKERDDYEVSNWTGDDVLVEVNNSYLRSVSIQKVKRLFSIIWQFIIDLKKKVRNKKNKVSNLRKTGLKKRKKYSEFTIPESYPILKELCITTTKLPVRGKGDITMEVWNEKLRKAILVVYSIKSFSWGLPTLLGFSEGTVYIFEAIGLTQENVDEINGMKINDKNSVMGKIKRVYELGGRLVFHSVAKETFSVGMTNIDSLIRHMLGYMLIYYYTSEIRLVKDLVNKLCEDNPFKLRNVDNYVKKIKFFLSVLAVGYDPNIRWLDYDDQVVGYLIFTKDQKVYSYDLEDSVHFENTLYENTKFDTPSSKDNRLGFIDNSGDKRLIRLGLQIRFTRP